MYIIQFVDPRTRRYKLLSAPRTATAALAAYMELKQVYPNVQIEAASDGFIEPDELARRAADEAVASAAPTP